MNRLLSLTLLLAGGALAAVAVERDDSWVRRRVEAIRKSDTEAWRRIPWSATLTAAAQTARREERLLFVFSHEGNIETGRC